MAIALIAWLSAPAPTTWTSTAPDCRMTPAIAPAQEFGLDLLETLRTSICPPPIPPDRTRCQASVRHGSPNLLPFRAPTGVAWRPQLPLCQIFTGPRTIP